MGFAYFGNINSTGGVQILSESNKGILLIDFLIHGQVGKPEIGTDGKAERGLVSEAANQRRTARTRQQNRREKSDMGKENKNLCWREDKKELLYNGITTFTEVRST